MDTMSPEPLAAEGAHPRESADEGQTPQCRRRQLAPANGEAKGLGGTQPESEHDSQQQPMPECRICFQAADYDRCGPLISPCRCSGTAKWVHASCLERWCETQVTPGSSRFRRTCELCGTAYQGFNAEPPRFSSFCLRYVVGFCSRERRVAGIRFLTQGGGGPAWALVRLWHASLTFWFSIFTLTAAWCTGTYLFETGFCRFLLWDQGLDQTILPNIFMESQIYPIIANVTVCFSDPKPWADRQVKIPPLWQFILYMLCIRVAALIRAALSQHRGNAFAAFLMTLLMVLWPPVHLWAGTDAQLVVSCLVPSLRSGGILLVSLLFVTASKFAGFWVYCVCSSYGDFLISAVAQHFSVSAGAEISPASFTQYQECLGMAFDVRVDILTHSHLIISAILWTRAVYQDVFRNFRRLSQRRIDLSAFAAEHIVGAAARRPQSS